MQNMDGYLQWTFSTTGYENYGRNFIQIITCFNSLRESIEKKMHKTIQYDNITLLYFEMTRKQP